MLSAGDGRGLGRSPGPAGLATAVGTATSRAAAVIQAPNPWRLRIVDVIRALTSVVVLAAGLSQR